MKKYYAIFCAILITMFLMTPVGVLAAGTTALSVSTNNPAQGETFTVTATATESGNMAVKYNGNVLSVVGCDVNGFTQSNGEVHFTGSRGTITFKADNVGGSAIAVSSSNASASSVVITVGAGAATAGASEDFELDGVKYTVSEKYSPEEVPEGFTQTLFQIGDKNLKGVTNGTMNLIYLKPVDNVNGPGKFYIYDQNSHSVSNYFFLGRADYYLIPSEPSELINSALRKGQITVQGQTVTVYTLQGIDDFVYVYGRCSDNTTGWFEYDVSGNTIQRINEAIFNNVSEGSAEGSGLASIIEALKSINIRYIIAGAAFIVIVIIAIIVNIVLKKRDDKADLIDGDEEFVGGNDKKLSREEKKRAKEEAKQAKAEAKDAAKDAKRAEKEAKKAAKLGIVSEEEYMDEIYDEYGDFDIDGNKDKPESVTEEAVESNNKDYKVEPVIEDDKAKPKSEDYTAESKSVDDTVEAKSSEDVAESKSTADNADADALSDDDYKVEAYKNTRSGKKNNKDIFDDNDDAPKKNIFGDDELDLTKERPRGKKKGFTPKTGKTGIIDLNDL